MARRSPDDRNGIFGGLLLCALGLGGAALVEVCSGPNSSFISFSGLGFGESVETPWWTIVLGCFLFMGWISLLLIAGTAGGCLGLAFFSVVGLGGAALDAPWWAITLSCFLSLGILLELLEAAGTAGGCLGLAFFSVVGLGGAALDAPWWVIALSCFLSSGILSSLLEGWYGEELYAARQDKKDHCILEQHLQEREEQLEKIRLRSQEKHLREQKEKRFRALKIADVDNMNPYEFERFVGELMKRQGYITTVVGQAGDMGVDIVAQKGDKKYAVQVKRHSSRVSRRAVSDAVAGKQHYGCNAAMVVTNNYFTKGAVELARSTRCQLVDRNTLADWIAYPHKGY